MIGNSKEHVGVVASLGETLGYYDVEFVCENCGVTSTQRIPKGKRVSDFKGVCDNCGCESLSRKRANGATCRCPKGWPTVPFPGLQRNTYPLPYRSYEVVC